MRLNLGKYLHHSFSDGIIILNHSVSYNNKYLYAKRRQNERNKTKKQNALQANNKQNIVYCELTFNHRTLIT